MKKIVNKKKGISTILAALLLVVIVVVASVIVYAWATGLFGGLMPSSPSVKEGLSMDSYKWTGNSTATLYIRNVGTVDVTVESYYIEEAGQTKSGPTDCGVTIAVNQAMEIPVTPEFTWVPGHSYTVKLITSRGTQFAFTVIAA